jgi:AraC-like DNA-binding protein
VLQVACEVGYDSEAAFSRAFKREFGVPPGQFRKSSGQPGPTAATLRLAPMTPDAA